MSVEAITLDSGKHKTTSSEGIEYDINIPSFIYIDMK